MNAPPVNVERVRDRESHDLARSTEATLDAAAADFAARVDALADLLQRWRRPALARTVLAALLDGDGDTFRELLRDFDPPLAGKCWWLRDVVQAIVADVEFRSVWRLRVDLSAGERRLYLQIALQHRRRSFPPPCAAGEEPQPAGLTITPGLFLDALRAEGLVTCVEEPVQAAGLQQVLARPAFVCA